MRLLRMYLCERLLGFAFWMAPNGYEHKTILARHLNAYAAEIRATWPEAFDRAATPGGA